MPVEMFEVKNSLTDGIIDMTIPDKPNSRLQKYRPADMGHKWLGVK